MRHGGFLVGNPGPRRLEVRGFAARGFDRPVQTPLSEKALPEPLAERTAANLDFGAVGKGSCAPAALPARCAAEGRARLR